MPRTFGVTIETKFGDSKEGCSGDFSEEHSGILQKGVLALGDPQKPKQEAY